MNPMRWRRRRHEAADAEELAAECEAFLAGRYAERVEDLPAPVPVWAWTNLLAHGSAEDLRAATVTPRRAAAGVRSWHSARAYLAVEVIEAAERYGSLSELQESVLVPLELSLAGRAHVDHWSCNRWVRTVRAALAGHRHARS